MSSSLVERYLAALHALAKAASAPGSPVTVRTATPDELQLLQGFGMRDPVLSLYAQGILDSEAETNVCVKDAGGIEGENRHLGPGFEINPLGFVVIGSSMCGDVFALDYHSPPGPDGTPRVLLVSHETGYDSADDVCKQSLVVADSLVEFLTGAASRRFDV